MQETGRGVSVIICCYNSSSRLEPTIEHLAMQKVRQGIDWEIIVVNNASEDSTTEVASALLSRYFNVGDYRIVEEVKPGLSHARRKGVSVARYSYVLFCDDDNWLDFNYVQTSFDFMETHPEVAILGGRTEPNYAAEPPVWFEVAKKSFAIGQQAIGSGPVGAVWGAGMVVRKRVYEKLFSLGFHHLNSDRYKDKLYCGGDTELCYAIARMGYQIWYHEALLLVHYIPAVRLSFQYTRKLFYYVGYALPSLEVYKYNENEVNDSDAYLSWRLAWRISCLRWLSIKAMPSRILAARTDMPKEFLLAIEKGRMHKLQEWKGKYNTIRKMILKAPWNNRVSWRTSPLPSPKNPIVAD